MADTLQAEHDALLAGLATRQCVKHFAHGAFSMVLSGILGGTVVKLGWAPGVPATLAALSALTLSYSAARMTLGARAYRRENRAASRLLELRAALGLNAPQSLSGVP